MKCQDDDQDEVNLGGTRQVEPSFGEEITSGSDDFFDCVGSDVGANNGHSIYEGDGILGK